MWLLGIIGFVTLVTCQSSPLTKIDLSAPVGKFTRDVYAQLGKSEKGNMVLSPFSIHTTMAMALAGSPQKSNTYKNLANALNLDVNNPKAVNIDYALVRNYFQTKNLEHKVADDCVPPEPVAAEESEDYDYYDGLETKVVDDCDPAIEISTGYKVYANKNVKISPDYKLAVNTYYKADVDEVDFSRGQVAADKINGFVDEATKGLIKEIVKPNSFDENTKVMLINAIYFFGKWKIPFEASQTDEMDFFVTKDKVVKHKYGMNMNENIKQIKHKSSKGEIGVLRMPYKDDNFAMYLILPPEGMDVREFDWNDLPLTEMKKGMQWDSTNLLLPKFKIEYEKDLKQLFQSLNAGDAFSSSADFCNMVRCDRGGFSRSEDKISISKVLHKAVIEVDEKGTKAAAVTGVGFGTRSDAKRNIWKFNRPFLYAIMDDKNHLPLFIGRVVDPTGQHELD